MYPSQHAGLTGLALVPLRLRGWSLPRLGLFAAGGVLIDVDHYLSYVWRERDLSLLNAYRWYTRRVPPVVHRRPHFYRPPLLVDRYRPFHTLAASGLLIAATTFAPQLRWLRPLAWGVLFHRLCDYSLEIFEGTPGVPKEPEE